MVGGPNLANIPGTFNSPPQSVIAMNAQKPPSPKSPTSLQRSISFTGPQFGMVMQHVN
jgi:hypothetical protein